MFTFFYRPIFLWNFFVLWTKSGCTHAKLGDRRVNKNLLYLCTPLMTIETRNYFVYLLLLLLLFLYWCISSIWLRIFINSNKHESLPCPQINHTWNSEWTCSFDAAKIKFFFVRVLLSFLFWFVVFYFAHCLKFCG